MIGSVKTIHIHIIHVLRDCADYADAEECQELANDDILGEDYENATCPRLCELQANTGSKYHDCLVKAELRKCREVSAGQFGACFAAIEGKVKASKKNLDEKNDKERKTTIRHCKCCFKDIKKEEEEETTEAPGITNAK